MDQQLFQKSERIPNQSPEKRRSETHCRRDESLSRHHKYILIPNSHRAEKGTLYSMGDNSEGQLGISEDNDRAYFAQLQPVVSLKDKKIVDAFCGPHHSFAITEDKEVYGWGVGQDFQLGTGIRQMSYFPTRIDSLCGLDIKAIACGWGHSIALVK